MKQNKLQFHFKVSDKNLLLWLSPLSFEVDIFSHFVASSCKIKVQNPLMLSLERRSKKKCMKKKEGKKEEVLDRNPN